MATGFLASAGLLALFQLSFVESVAAEEAPPEVKPGKPETNMPAELGDAFDVPAGPKDACGNLIRQGTDRKIGLPLEIRHKASGMHFVFIPPWEFMMGSPDNEKDRNDDEKQHKVTLAKPFYMGKYEVTVGQFKAFVRGAGYRTDAEKDGMSLGWIGNRSGRVEGASWQKPGFGQTDNHPVTEVSWNDAKAFCDRISKGQSARVGLPSEAQWEYACRAGSKGPFFWGENETKAGHYANVAPRKKKLWLSGWLSSDMDDRYALTSPVGKLRPNDFGLYDMSGNVWEWCEDGYHRDSEGAPGDGRSAVSDASDGERVIRGGYWQGGCRACRCANRYGLEPGHRDDYTGFRVVVPYEWLR
jgi:formylglycine-generating enzyme required for sulfatase activity